MRLSFMPRLAMWFCLSAAFACSSVADGAEKKLLIEPPVEQFKFYSETVQQEFVISVGLPVSRADETERLPVLYVVDATGGIGALDLFKSLQIAGEVRRFITVGIGYPVDSPLAASVIRVRDLTPTQSDQFNGRNSLPIAGVEEVLEGDASGGGPAFLRFIEFELMPEINHRYATIKDDTGYFGHSLGGLFGLYAMMERPELFDRLILGSPSLWYDDEALFENLRDAVRDGGSLRGRVFVGVGGLEERAAPQAQLVSNLVELDAILAGMESEDLNYRFRIFENETHSSVVADIFKDGIRHVYGPADCSPVWGDC